MRSSAATQVHRLSRTRVFVVNQPLRRDRRTGELEETFSLAPATAFGELVHLTDPGSEIGDGAAAIEDMAARLSDFAAGDYLLPVGDPALIGVAVTLAAYSSGGFVTLLKWNRERGKRRPAGYHPYTVDLSRYVNPL